MQPGDFCLVRGPGVRGAVIRWWIDCPVSHAAVYVGGGTIVHALPAGVVSDSVFNLPGPLVWSTDRLPWSLDDVQRQAISAFVVGMLGTRYAWSAILAGALRQKGLSQAAAVRVAGTVGATCTQMI